MCGLIVSVINWRSIRILFVIDNGMVRKSGKYSLEHILRKETDTARGEWLSTMKDTCILV